MNPTRYQLEEIDGHYVLRMFAQECVKGYSVLERVPIITGKSLAGLRKWGHGRAKHFGVPFIDKTA